MIDIDKVGVVLFDVRLIKPNGHVVKPILEYVFRWRVGRVEIHIPPQLLERENVPFKRLESAPKTRICVTASNPDPHLQPLKPVFITGLDLAMFRQKIREVFVNIVLCEPVDTVLPLTAMLGMIPHGLRFVNNLSAHLVHG